MNLTERYLSGYTRVMRADGTYMTRGEIIREMQEQGIKQRYIDRYLQGLDRKEAENG